MFTITAVKQLLKRGIETHLLCLNGSKIELNAEKEKIKTIPLKSNGYFNPLQIMKLARLLKKENYDLVHTQASADLWTIVPALNIAKSPIPLFLTKQVGSFVIKKDFLHKALYKRVSLAFAISSVIKKNLIETTPLNESRISLLHNGVNTNAFDPEKFNGENIRREFNISPNEILIGMIARFTPGKGHEEFLESAKIISRKFHNVKFLIVGEPSLGEDAYAAKIKSLAENLELNKKVIFTGFRSDVANVLSAIDIFIFPSHSEAFGIALVEAMSMQKPVVCSRADGTLDICIDNETGLFFEKGNYIDLATKTELLLNDKSLREKLSNNARKRAVEKFDIEVLTDKVIGFYQKFLP